MQKKKISKLTLWILVEIVLVIVVLAVLVALIANVWGDIAQKLDDKKQKDEPKKTPKPVQTQPEKPVDTTPEGILETFLEDNDLTMADYPAWFEEVYAISGENRQFLLNYPMMYGKEQKIDISGVSRDTVPLFIQWDDRWGYLDYNGNICGVSGCGPTCLSMVAYYWTGDAKYSPDYMLDFATQRGYAVPGAGTDWNLFNKGAVELGFEVKTLSKVEKHVADKVKAGIPVVVSMAPGTFTTTGHFMVLVGYEDGKFRINDCNSPEKSARLWAWEEFEAEVRQFWAISMPEE